MRGLVSIVISLFLALPLMAQSANELVEKRISGDVDLFESDVMGDITALKLTAKQREAVAEVYRKMYDGLAHLDPYTDGKRKVSQAYQDAHVLARKDAVALLTTEQRLNFMSNEKE